MTSEMYSWTDKILPRKKLEELDLDNVADGLEVAEKLG